MCAIAGVVQLKGELLPKLGPSLQLMNKLQAHRGPDGEGVWLHKDKRAGFAHRRLSIIDLAGGSQPMSHEAGVHIVFNGEIYNYLELREELGADNFRTKSDTEVIVQAYLKWGRHCVTHLRGMFAFAIWDERDESAFIVRDRIGIKPLYYIREGDALYFASEVKALLPFLSSIEVDPDSLQDYLTFQLYLEARTLFKGVMELPPGALLELNNQSMRVRQYWTPIYVRDDDHSPLYFERRLAELFDESVAIHCRADVPIGAYLSGGVDSSLVAATARAHIKGPMNCFLGKYSLSKDYDESRYARVVASDIQAELHELDISVSDFISNISKVIYHLDYPVAGPGAFSQYMISGLAARHNKVVLGGQGGDEIFGGYVRYLIAYFEQCILGAVDGTLNNGNFLVTYESIIPNLTALRGYKQMLQEFWREGLFQPMDQRYFRLINRGTTLRDEINWEALGDYSPFDAFQQLFNSSNVAKQAYFDKMTHFDFRTLLPALLQVEDRVSMAHGLESRVPFLDHRIIEFAASAPPNVKFMGGRLKHWLLSALGNRLPPVIRERKDKMGFPTPINVWAKGEAKTFISDVFNSKAAKERAFFNHSKLMHSLSDSQEYGRKLWGLLSLELWCREFIDKAHEFQAMGKAL